MYLRHEETIILLLWCTLKSHEHTYFVYVQPAETTFWAEWEIGNKAMGNKAVYPIRSELGEYSPQILLLLF